jgi:dGTPase
MRNKSEPVYNRLLSAERWRPTTVKGRSLEEEAESDRGRVLFSAPFRRLQSKAQVFSLETNASVRSRLTHSLEVATFGRQVAQAAVRAIVKAGRIKELGLSGKETAFVTFVDTVCLLHDIGNPPFGHFGETAISDWFFKKKDNLGIKDIAGGAADLWNQHYTDLVNFDGNPQGFRIITRLQATETDNLEGLNLTVTTLAAAIKYPYDASELNHEKGRKKIGYFRTEQDVVEWIRETLRLKSGYRHPLVTLMEAADDIAYCLSDIEDGIEKQVISARDFSEFVEPQLGKFERHPIFREMMPKLRHALKELVLQSQHSSKSRQRLTPFMDVRVVIARYLATYAGNAFAARHDSILEGEAEPLLPDNGPDALLAVFKSFASSHLYPCAIVRQREISGHRILTGLLDCYFDVMACEEERFIAALQDKPKDENGRRITIERSLINRLAEKHKKVYLALVNRARIQHPGDHTICRVLEKIYRIRLVVDTLSGMTDDHALRFYQLVSGVEI